MPETLLSPSNILLYGRVLTDLTVVHQGPQQDGPQQKQPTEEEIHRPFAAPRVSSNRFLDVQLENAEATLARIYGFSFEGHYFDLAKPALFVVHGDGKDADDVKPGNRAARAPADADRTGIAAQEYTFSDDMKVWSYDKGDFSIRLDIEAGPFEDILLEMELSGDRLASSYKGMDARIRTSGMDARIRTSGMDARLRGRGGNRGD